MLTSLLIRGVREFGSPRKVQREGRLFFSEEKAEPALREAKDFYSSALPTIDAINASCRHHQE
jgi:hypothetical protein